MAEILRSRKSFQAISSQWESFAASSHSPSMHHDWFASCLASLYAETETHVLIIRENNQITAAAPLVLMQKKGMQWLELIGATKLGEPSGVLFTNEVNLSKLITTLLDLKLPLVLSRVETHSPLTEKLPKLAKGHGILFHRHASPSLATACTSTWEEFYSSLSSRRHYDHRRAQKRAEQAGKISFQALKPNVDDFSSVLDKALKVEAAGWKKRNGTALLVNEELCSFFHHYSRLAAQRNILTVFFMLIDKQPVAMQLCVECANKLWVLKIGYDEKWARCSPGILLMNYAIKYAFENNLKHYEFLGTSESWLQVWSNTEHNYSNLIYYPYSTKGVARIGVDLLQFGAKRVKRKLRHLFSK